MTPDWYLELYLFNNTIGDAGVEALVKAVADGALPVLQALTLSGNLVSNKVAQVARNAVTNLRI
jgi:hypothetical protein